MRKKRKAGFDPAFLFFAWTFRSDQLVLALPQIVHRVGVLRQEQYTLELLLGDG